MSVNRPALNIVLDAGTIATAEVSSARSSQEVFILKLAESLARKSVAVVVTSTRIDKPVSGPGFLLVPRRDVRSHVDGLAGIVLRFGYDPRFMFRTLALSRKLGWRRGVYVFDYYGTALEFSRLDRKLAGEVLFRVGLGMLRLFDHVLIVNPEIRPWLPRSVARRAVLTRVGASPIEGGGIAYREPGLVVFAGSLTRENLVLELIEAFGTVGCEPRQLVIYGDGPLRDQVAALALRTPNCSFLGLQLNSVIADVQSRAWLTVALRKRVLPAGAFSFPSKLVECLGSGAVTVGSSHCVVPDLGSVALVSGDDIASIARSIELGLELPRAEHVSMSSAARDLVCKEFSWDKIANELLNQLQPPPPS
ncbi:glycosyltransferase [Dietzia maris]|uniref:glycosyltransferase n=1 Tax=Dietzia maris TaxID=37915 RepID=UPI0037C611EB